MHNRMVHTTGAAIAAALILSSCGPSGKQPPAQPDPSSWSVGPVTYWGGGAYGTIHTDRLEKSSARRPAGAPPTEAERKRGSAVFERPTLTRDIIVLAPQGGESRMTIEISCPDGKPRMDARDTPRDVADRVLALSIGRLCGQPAASLQRAEAIGRAREAAMHAASSTIPATALEAERRYGGQERAKRSD